MRYLILFIFSLSFSSLVAAESESESQCPLINCDCANLLEPEWQESCYEREKHLQKSCAANKGRLTGFCYMSGRQASPLALSVKPLGSTSDSVAGVEEKRLRARIKDLQWSAEDDRNVALASQLASKYRQALLLRKRENKTRKQVYQSQRLLGAFWSSQDNIDKAVDLWLDIAEEITQVAAEEQLQAETLWQSWQDTGDTKLQRHQQLLALRIMANSGNLLEQSAYAYGEAGQPTQAADYWQRAARSAEQLVAWQQSIKAKASHIQFYQQQAAARWFRAALTSIQADQSSDAQMARSEALRVLGLVKKQVAGS
jgi:hypothetical protein